MSDHNLPREAPIAGTELESLLGSLERQRAIFGWKCGGLDSAGLQASHPPSTMTLGGLIKHVALVEDEYLTHRLRGVQLGAPWDAVDWDADSEWEWHSAADDTPEQLYALWQDSVERSRAAVAAALDEGGLDYLAQYKNSRGETPSLRRIMVDMIEEYARHAGHADLIRETVDGLTGEEPPR
ncbi:MAG: hypothetical protein QOH84_5121 [Kribbellaceae bacterium]|nr:hypothetical protein [Kribbellaceae bacterium]